MATKNVLPNKTSRFAFANNNLFSFYTNLIINSSFKYFNNLIANKEDCHER